LAGMWGPFDAAFTYATRREYQYRGTARPA
jgi:hypothetical protein